MRTLVPLLVFCAAAGAQSSRQMADLNWMEFRELAPAKVATVLLATGTVEAHGVANNGADATAPVAPRVNALVAPTVPYGVTGSLDAYAGGMTIGEESYCAYVGDVLAGFPSPIILYQPGQGYVRFDQGKANEYFQAVADKTIELVRETVSKWDQAGIFSR